MQQDVRLDDGQLRTKKNEGREGGGGQCARCDWLLCEPEAAWAFSDGEGNICMLVHSAPLVTTLVMHQTAPELRRALV